MQNMVCLIELQCTGKCENQQNFDGMIQKQTGWGEENSWQSLRIKLTVLRLNSNR